MAKTFSRMLATAIVSGGLSLMAADLATAKGPKGIGGPGVGQAHAMAPGVGRGQRIGWHGANRPPGWSRGRKVGWRGGNVPPGLR